MDNEKIMKRCGEKQKKRFELKIGGRTLDCLFAVARGEDMKPLETFITQSSFFLNMGQESVFQYLKKNRGKWFLMLFAS